jgi:hypothetical protein
VTGLVGKRGNQDAYRIGTSTATIGIRGSSGETLDCVIEGCDGVISGGDKLDRGVYHATFTGTYIAATDLVPQTLIGEGQFAFIRDRTTPPVLIPSLPGGVNVLLEPRVGSPLSKAGGSCGL